MSHAEDESGVVDAAQAGPGVDGAPDEDAQVGEGNEVEVLDDETVEAAEAVVEADLAELARERDDFRELAQRVQADFENYRKRVMREQTAVVERATEGLVTELLSVLDSFELALGTLEESDEKVRKGVELVYSGLLGALERVGLERIPTEGAPFDPTVHEAVLQEDGDGEPVVVETMRSGFRLKGKVLRAAMVKVGH
ncbi:MAG: nucleotide exchange factor GrpE [Acidimicrobiia bacterium]|jgi:molecular chaperone GrpE